MSEHEKWMRRAIELSVQNVEKGGGPFGAVIVKDGQLIAEGYNRVTALNDPTMHAEVMAIREACKKLNTFDLSGCIIYTSCEPCPMCLGAVYWARISEMYFANTKQDADSIGFSDEFIYKEIEKPYHLRTLKTHQILREEALTAFEKWKVKEDKIQY
ncbi:MAG: tRNA-specific adenosine deaminase [Bacteroidia bacterium]|nr:MAG: tRNA-specific adenosine deaminase [Bacteroidia bacterium]